MGDVTSLGNLPYIPAASDVADIMAHTHNLTQQQQMLNHQTNNNNNNSNVGNLIGLSMDAMQQSPTHSHQQSLNIKPDYGLTAL